MPNQPAVAAPACLVRIEPIPSNRRSPSQALSIYGWLRHYRGGWL
jgi:hypothetical protein